MKILIVGGNPNTTVGSELAIRNIVKILAKKNKVYLFTSLPVFLKNSKGIYFNDVHVLKKTVSFNIVKEAIKNSVSCWMLIYPYLKFNPKGIAYYLIALFYSVLIKCYLKKYDPQIINVHGSLNLQCLPIIDESIKLGIPLIVTMHGVFSLDPSITLDFKKKLEKDVFSKLKNNNSIIIAVSTQVKQQIVNNFNYPPDLITVVGNGVNLDKFHHNPYKKILRENENLPSGKIILIQVGSLIKRKNHIAVLEAINSSNSLKDRLLYIIIGDGPEKDRLMKYCRNNGLNKTNVLFKGSVHNDKISKWYELSDFFILPSTSEGLPLVFLEAIASGLPIITFEDLQGVKDIYKPFLMELIKERTPESISETIIKAMGKNWDQNQISKHAKNYSWNSVVKTYTDCYKNAIFNDTTKKIT
jgi:glycosyltransferase involved in cell wall biosynthesis